MVKMTKPYTNEPVLYYDNRKVILFHSLKHTVPFSKTLWQIEGKINFIVSM